MQTLRGGPHGSLKSVNRKVDGALLLMTPLGVFEPTNRYYVSKHMNKIIVALVAGLFVTGAAVASEASAPVAASGATTAKASTHKHSKKSKKAAKASEAVEASAASAAK